MICFCNLSLGLTVEIPLELLERVGPIMPLQAHEARDGLCVLVREPLDEHLLVGAAGPYLHPLQLQELLEDAPLDVIPSHQMRDK